MWEFHYSLQPVGHGLERVLLLEGSDKQVKFKIFESKVHGRRVRRSEQA